MLPKHCYFAWVRLPPKHWYKVHLRPLFHESACSPRIFDSACSPSIVTLHGSACPPSIVTRCICGHFSMSPLAPQASLSGLAPQALLCLGPFAPSIATSCICSHFSMSPLAPQASLSPLAPQASSRSVPGKEMIMRRVDREFALLDARVRFLRLLHLLSDRTSVLHRAYGALSPASS